MITKARDEEEAVDRLSIGQAVNAMKGGRRVRRAAWKAGWTWICLSPGNPDCPADQFWAPWNRLIAQNHGGKATVLPYVTMKTADGSVVPWTCSQEDLLAVDWELVPNSEAA